jgi:hypothetical protein
MEIKTLCHGGYVKAIEQTERNGVPVGIVEGYIATWDVDRGGWDGVKDQFIRGAFTKSLERHRKTGRQIRFKDMHGRTVGGFPIETVKEDDIGLFGRAEINLEVQQGREAFSLAKQKVLVDFSVGWGLGKGSTIKDGVRSIPEAEIWEGSIVDEPMNPAAQITAVKAIDFSTLSDVEIRELERAMKEGIKFDNKDAKQIISLMKSAGMLRDEHSGSRDGDLKQLNEALDKLITNCKE